MKDIPPAKAGLLALYSAILLLALNGLFAKLIPLDATNITQVRSVVACAALVLALVLQRSSLRLASLKQYVGVYGLGVLLGLHWITYFHAMQVSTVAIGMLSLFSYPVITVVIEPLFKGLAPKLKDLAAALIVFVGVFAMVSPELIQEFFSAGPNNLNPNNANQGVIAPNEGLSSTMSSTIEGAFWGIASAVLFSLRNTSQKYLFPHVDSVTLMAHQTFVVGLMLIPFIDVTQVASMEVKGWVLVILLGCFCTALAHTLLSMSLKRLPAKSVALIGCNVPVVGGVMAWLALGEVPNPMVYIGGVVILSVAAYESLVQQDKEKE